ERTGERRVVIFTDELVRSSLAAAAAEAALGALARDVVVHVVVPQASGEPALARDDKLALAPMATRHRGIMARLSGTSGDAAELEQAALELVRPTKLERVGVVGFTVAPVLGEGATVRIAQERKAAPPRVTLRGVLWSDEVVRELDGGGDFGRATAGFVFSESKYRALRLPEQRTLALAAHAVTPVTSFVAVGAGQRAREINPTITLGRYSTTTRCGLRVGTATIIPRIAELRPLIDVRACVAKHRPPAGWKQTLRVETTLDEIVDVVADHDSPFAACLVETVWSARLDNSFQRPRHTYTVELD
ncbi:MAG: hypothetical protein KIT31_33610, partial [Deltaproteobacteria bacterium]|nr:hypothetical protein [Deltaproteobacteria bacterium]